MRRKPMLLLHHVSCPSRWCCVALLCYYDRLVSAAAIRRQVCRRFGVTVSGMGYKVKMLGGRKALGALGWHQGKLLLCSCLCDLVPKWCKKWKAKAAFRFRGLGTMPWTIMVYILVLIITYFSWTHFHVMFVIKKKQKIMTIIMFHISVQTYPWYRVGSSLFQGLFLSAASSQSHSDQLQLCACDVQQISFIIVKMKPLYF